MDDMERVGLLRRKPLVQPLSMQKKKKEREGEGMITQGQGGMGLLSDVSVPWTATGQEAQSVLGTEQNGDQGRAHRDWQIISTYISISKF